MKLKKTREFCQNRIDENRESQMGRPILDIDVNDVGEELKDAEIKIKLLYVSLLLNVVFCIILSTK